jgi:hypothetical protein
MNDTEKMRKLMTMLTESTQPDIDPNFAVDLLAKMSPTFKDAEDEIMETLGATVAFIAVFVGGVEVANVGPLDMTGATKMQRQITQDIQTSYDDLHPNGFTDNTGTIYRMQDWDINIETCHSSQCNDIVGPRMDAIRARSIR